MNIFKKNLGIFLFSLALFSFSIPIFVTAQPRPAQMTAPDASGIITNPLSGVNSLPQLLDKVLSALVQIGIPFIVIAYIWAGFKYVTAFGDASAVTKATEIFKWTTVGAGVLLGSKALAMILRGTLDSVGLRTGMDWITSFFG